MAQLPDADYITGHRVRGVRVRGVDQGSFSGLRRWGAAACLDVARRRPLLGGQRSCVGDGNPARYSSADVDPRHCGSGRRVTVMLEVLAVVGHAGVGLRAVRFPACGVHTVDGGGSGRDLLALETSGP